MPNEISKYLDNIICNLSKAIGCGKFVREKCDNGGGSSSGRISDFGSEGTGSNPVPPAKTDLEDKIISVLCKYKSLPLMEVKLSMWQEYGEIYSKEQIRGVLFYLARIGKVKYQVRSGRFELVDGDKK